MTTATSTAEQAPAIEAMPDGALVAIMREAIRGTSKLQYREVETAEYKQHVAQLADWDDFNAFDDEHPKPMPKVTFAGHRYTTISNNLPVIQVAEDVYYQFLHDGIGSIPPSFAHESFPDAQRAYVELQRRTAELLKRKKEDRFKAEVQAWIEKHIPKAFRGCTFQNYKPQNKKQEEAATYLAAWKGFPNFFTVGGPTGIGKTHLVIAKVLQLVSQKVYPRFIKEVDLLQQWQDHHQNYDRRDEDLLLPNDYLRNWAKYPVIVLDDLGTAAPTEKGMAALWKVIEYRLDHELPTMITTNFTAEALKPLYGERFVSRVFRSGDANFFLEGPDQRGRYRREGVGVEKW